MSDSKPTYGGIGFMKLLALAFIVLKLCNVIDWSWWWVTCPIWGPIVLALAGVPFKVMKKRKKR
jgi:hypothetical protein